MARSRDRNSGPARRDPGIPKRVLGPCSWLLALVAGCAEIHDHDFDDINLPIPNDLPERLKDYRSGVEPWHGDPKAVADLALRYKVDHLPWMADPFRPSEYTVLKNPEWGTYVVRGYIYPSGHLMRYRVKIRAYQEIWYPVQISRYKRHEMSDDDQWHPHDH